MKRSWLRKLTFDSERVVGVLGIVLISLHTSLAEWVRELVDFWGMRAYCAKEANSH
jgi:hypothetical protein